MIATSIQSLLQPVPSPERLREQPAAFAVGDTMDVEELLAWLVRNGFQQDQRRRVAGRVLACAAASWTFLPPDWIDPVRIEFFGDEVESIRRFEVATPAQPGALEEPWNTILDRTARTTGSTCRLICPRGLVLSDRTGRTSRKRGGAISNGWNGRRIITA